MFGYWLYINNSVFVFNKMYFSLDKKNEIFIYFDWRFWWFLKIYYFSLLVLSGFMSLFIQKVPCPLKSQCDFVYLSSPTNIIRITHHLSSWVCFAGGELKGLILEDKHSLGYWLRTTCKDLVLFRVLAQEDQQNLHLQLMWRREGSRLRIYSANCNLRCNLLAPKCF